MVSLLYVCTRTSRNCCCTSFRYTYSNQHARDWTHEWKGCTTAVRPADKPEVLVLAGSSFVSGRWWENEEYAIGTGNIIPGTRYLVDEKAGQTSRSTSFPQTTRQAVVQTSRRTLRRFILIENNWDDVLSRRFEVFYGETLYHSTSFFCLMNRCFWSYCLKMGIMVWGVEDFDNNNIFFVRYFKLGFRVIVVYHHGI